MVLLRDIVFRPHVLRLNLVSLALWHCQESYNSLLNQKTKSRASSELKDLGKHPDTDQPIKVMNGRYGPYIKHGKKNIGLPKGTEPESVTLDKAMELIAAKG